MVHTAYDSVELLKGCPTRIDAVAAYASKLLLGCSDASLRIYAPASVTPSSSSAAAAPSLASGDEFDTLAVDLDIRREEYVPERTLSGFWKRSPLAMEVLRSRDLLLSLSEWIALHRLPNLETVVAFGKTKGAHIYCWDDRRGLLCVGRQKRVAIYRLDGGREFVEVKEFGVSDAVKSMAWCGENICLGIRKDYMIMNSTTGTMTELFSSGRVAPPLVIPLPLGELLLGKDNIGLLVDQNGKLLQDGRILWSEAPASVVIHKPYAVGRLPKHIEIRSLRAPYSLVQTIGLRDVNLLVQSSNSLIAALKDAVYGLLPVPLGAQIVQLTASGDFEEALALCKLLPREDSTLRAAKESSIHIRYAHHLFDKENYEKSMEQFLASQVDVTYVLSIYPSIVLPNLLPAFAPDQLSESTDGSHLSTLLSDVPNDTDLLQSQLDESDDKSHIKSKKMSHNAILALIKFLQKKRHGIFERATAEVTDEVVSDAMHGSITFSDPYKSKNTSKRRYTNISSVARETATILDTALLQAMLLAGQTSGALEFLKGANFCDLKICEEFLKERKHYMVLLELYKYNEMHREALKLLNQLVEGSDSGGASSELHGKFKPDVIIEYLKPLCRTDPMLVLESSMHILETSPRETIELFLSGNVPAELVNSYLKQHAPNMQSTYLELMLSMSENGINPKLQNELVQIYLSEVAEWYNDLKKQQKWDEKTYSPTRKKLLSALENISGYSADDILKRLPLDALYEERAVLLGRMNLHHLALSIYVHKLHLPQLAVEYCDRVYETGLRQTSPSYANIYLTLLEIYLNPNRALTELEQRTLNPGPVQSIAFQRAVSTKGRGGRQVRKIASIEGADDMRISTSSTDSGRSDGDVDEMTEGGPIMLKEALDLLSQKWNRINGAQALRLLPKHTKLQDLLSFLQPLLRKSTEGRRNYSVIKNLRSSENLQVKEELYNHRRTVVKIDGDSICSLCHKKIGSSVFAVYPNGKTLVHFVCFRDSQNIKAVRGVPKMRLA